MPPLHQRVVTATREPSTTCARRSAPRAGARRARARLRADPGGARRHGRVGTAVLRAARAAQRRSAHLPFDRRAGKPALLPSAPLPERPARHAPRGERRRDPAPQRRARPHRRRAQGALRRPGLFSVDEHPPRLRGRRLRRRPEPAEADGDRRRHPRRRPDPRHGRALPRLHVDAEGGARPAQDREPRDARLRRPRAAATSAAARTCTSRTSPRSSRRGTSTSTSTSASRRRSGPGSTSRRARRPCRRRRRTSRRARRSTRDFKETGRFGHSASIQATSRLL